MNASGKEIIVLIDAVRASLKSRKLLFYFSALVASASFLLIIFDRLSKYFAWREDQQFGVLLFVALPFTILVFKGLRDFYKRSISRQEIALKVEASTPELMDSYVCAMEIAERGGPRGRIEEALSSSVAQRFESGEIKKLVTPRYLKTLPLNATVILSLLFILALSGNSILKNSVGYLKYQKTGIHTGIEVTPGDIFLAIGSDLKVDVTIKRGEFLATLEYEQDGAWQSLEMVDEGEGQFSAIVYAIESDFNYRVITPAFKSKSFKVSTYLKPNLENFEVTVRPPAYTGKPSFIIKELSSFAIPERSELSLSLKANKDVKFTLIQNAQKTPISNSYQKENVYKFKPVETLEYFLSLADDSGHEEVTEAFKVSVVRDIPPHIEIIKPAKDLQKTKFDIVTLEVTALDDYGLTAVDLFLEFSFGSSEKYSLLQLQNKQLSKEENLFYDLDLKKLGLSEGDVITYYLEAKDNCEPKTQASRTKIFFLEIRPDKNDVQDDKEQEGEQQGEISISDLIASQKDLIRRLIDVKSTSARTEAGEYVVEAEVKQELSSQTATLSLAVKKRMDKLNEEAEKAGASLGEIGDWFKSSVANLKSAEKLLNGGKLVKGLQANNKSLSDLIKIAIELEKNSQKSKSKSKEKPKEQPPEEQQQKEQERLADMLKKLEDLEDQQEEINEQMKELDKEELAEKKDLEEQMQDQQKKMEKMTESLEEQQQQQASGEMQQASEQMKDAKGQMQQGNSEGAQQAAQKAKEKISNAKNDIKKAMRDQARKKLKQLADKLDKTIEQQEELNDATKKMTETTSAAAKQDLAKMKKNQDQIKQDMQGIMDQLGAAANELDEKYPEVSEALREAREYAANQGVDRRLKRSSNALHYRRKDAAIREQEKAADSMAMLGHKVRDAVSRLPQASLEELLQMRQDVEMARRQVGSGGSGMSSAQLGERSTQIQKMLEDMGEALQDSKLQFDLPSALQGMKGKTTGANAVKGQMSVLNQAAFMLDSMISQADLEKRLTLNKRTGNAPDKYKRSVREYLKSLSEEKK
jgi:hypothetical protein